MGVQYVQDRQNKYILGHSMHTLLIQGVRIITYTDITAYAINGAYQYNMLLYWKANQQRKNDLALTKNAKHKK